MQEIVPVEAESVQFPEAPVLVRDIRFGFVPLTVKVETVVVEFGKIIECAAVPSSLKSLKVFEPVIVIEPVLAPRENQILLYVNPPPLKVIAVLILM